MTKGGGIRGFNAIKGVKGFNAAAIFTLFITSKNTKYPKLIVPNYFPKIFVFFEFFDVFFNIFAPEIKPFYNLKI